MGYKRITSRPSLLGYTQYYDEKGRCIGKSRPGMLGTTVYYDHKGRLAGTSRPGFLAKEVFNDKDYKDCIITYGGIMGDAHYKNGEPIGRTTPGWCDTAYITLEDDDFSYEDDSTQRDYCLEQSPNEIDNRTIVKNVVTFSACFLGFALIMAIFTLLS